MKEIIINKRYFNNIETSINSLNEYFSSNYKVKNFPNLENSDLDEEMNHIITTISSIDARWIDDEDVANEAIDKLNEKKEDYVQYVTTNEGGDFFDYCSQNNDQVSADLGTEYLSFKALQFAADHQEDFSKLLNGIYSFELFLKPSAYKNEISLFSQNVPIVECEDVMSGTEFKIFDPRTYIQGIFENDDITMPEDMNITAETERFMNYTDLTGVEVKVNEAIQEAAEVNFFTDTKPKHIKYDGKKWMISQQFEKTVNNLVAALRKCNDTDDLKTFFENDSKKYAKDLNDTVVPFILVQAMIKKGKEVGGFTKYSDSYASIISKNKGAKRFENYDIFTTFKADKEGTIKFIENFCKLKFVNDPSASITNNTVLTLFNIFDSRIYFDILYNMIPDKVKKTNGMDEDSFVRSNRGRINKNSRASNTYAADKAEVTPNNEEQTTEEINEYVTSTMRILGDMDISDMVHCESWRDMLRAEISTLDSGLHKAQIPVSGTNEYIGESFDVINHAETDIIMEADGNGQIVSNSVLGCFIGTSSVTTAASITASPLTLILFIDASGVKSPTCSEIASNVAKKSRGKNIKAEIIRDVLSIIRAMAKEADGEIDAYTLKDMKKRGNQLRDTLSFALRRKDTFNDTEKENLIDLHHAATKMGDLTPNDVSKNDKIVRSFFKASDAVVMMITKINPDDIDNFANIGEPEPVENEPVSEEPVSEEPTTEEPVSEETRTEDDEPVSESAVIQETDKGAIPAYMKTRMQLSDESGNKPETKVEDVNPPSGDEKVPSNPIDDLADSINEKVDGAGDDLKDMIGKEAKKEGSNIVVNINNNYNYSNSFNKSSNDLSTGKSMKIDNSVNDNSVKDQSVKDQSVKDQSVKDQSKKNNTSPSNNKYNSTTDSNTKDEKKVQEFSTGYSVEDVFAFLESEEPLLEADGANKPPKEDSLTKAMDRDRKKLPKQQAAKKTANKVVSTAKAVAKPAIRTKQWLLGIVDSLVQRSDDKVKAEIIQERSYRTALYKAMRIAIKAGLAGVAWTISGYLCAAYVAIVAAKEIDKQRLKKEVRREFAVEMRILDDKIRVADQNGDFQDKWKMMRLRSKMESIAANEATHQTIAHPSSVQ